MKRLKQQGIALVLVLWILALLTIITSGYSRMMRTEMLLTTNLIHSAKANALAEAGINIAIIELLKPVIEQQWKTDGRSYEYQLNSHIVKIRIRAESGKIDLNTARSELLQGLLTAINNTEKDILPLLQAILDWRDKDNLVRSHGAEDENYKNAGLSYGAKNGPFNSLDELLLVQGFTPKFYRKLRPALTIYSHNAGIFPQSAPREALLAIPLISTTTVDNYLVQRESTHEPGQLLQITGVDPKYLTKKRGTVFSITSEAKINNTLTRLHAVVTVRKNDKRPYSIIFWDTAPPVSDEKIIGLEPS